MFCILFLLGILAYIVERHSETLTSNQLASSLVNESESPVGLNLVR
jgi:hypothetical protein